MNIKKCLIIPLCALIMMSFAGCVFNLLPDDENSENEAGVYDVNRFFLEKVEYELANEYIICYKKVNGDVIEIKNVGFNEIPLIIAKQRIFYANGFTVIAVSLDGAEIEELVINIDPDKIYTFERVNSTDGEWLYCSGKKEVYIYGDSVAVDGVHYVPAKFKVKADFSEYYEVDE